MRTDLGHWPQTPTTQRGLKLTGSFCKAKQTPEHCKRCGRRDRQSPAKPCQTPPAQGDWAGQGCSPRAEIRCYTVLGAGEDRDRLPRQPAQSPSKQTIINQGGRGRPATRDDILSETSNLQQKRIIRHAKTQESITRNPAEKEQAAGVRARCQIRQEKTNLKKP